MQDLQNSAAGYRQQESAERQAAAARISLQLLAGEDLETTMSADETERRRVVSKLMRRLERERQRGLRGHWSYSLDRHIGLRQALDMIAGRVVGAPA